MLHMCVCAFLLHQERPDQDPVDGPLIYEVVLSHSVQQQLRFCFFLAAFTLYSFSISFSELFMLKISDVFVVVFSDKHSDYPHFYLSEDMRLCSIV
jgi:hypothetical protein